MKSYTGLKVSQRLVLGFGTLIAIGVVIALIGTFRMRTLAHDLSVMSGEQMTQMRQFVLLKDNLNTAALNLRNIMIDDSGQRRAVFKGAIEKVQAENQRLLSELDRVTATSRGRELLRGIKADGNAYEQAFASALEHSMQGDTAGANSELLKARDPRLALFKGVEASIDLQYEQAKQLSESAAQLASTTAWLMMTLALATAVVGGLVTWVISRQLMLALGAEPAALCVTAQSFAEGDLSASIRCRAGDSNSALAALQRAQSALLDIVGQVREHAESVSTASREIANGNLDLSQRTEEQASALQQTAATMDELGATVRNNADSAEQACHLALGASEVAGRGGQVVSEVVQTMQGINQSSHRIADIIGVIDGIAFQTNILALNAAVEAARAGEQGRGFAVVAGEVRNLAQRSAEAAGEIKTLINTSTEWVERGSVLVDRARGTMEEVVSEIERLKALVSEISAASGEQSRGVGQIGEAINQMDKVTQQNAALVEQSAAAAESLKVQAQQLVQAVAAFRLH